MNFDQIFRGFWGSSEPHNSTDDDIDMDRESGDFEDPFHSMDAEINTTIKHFQRQFGTIMNAFMGISGPLGNFENIPSLQPPTEVPLRDQFLKEPDSEEQKSLTPYEKPKGWFNHWFSSPPGQDRDLDKEVSTYGIDSLLKEDASPLNRGESYDMKPQFKSSVRSFYSYKSDGKVEQRYTKRDSLGNEETVVKRQIGDKSHSVVTRKNSRGVEEHEENFQNMDDKNVEDFNRRWNSNEPKFLPPTNRSENIELPSSTTGLYQRLFEKFLPKDKP